MENHANRNKISNNVTQQPQFTRCSQTF
uniref:Uncharacterized protein n=1 Tax=Anguilla anguilla TaxID=7936 RepID=A0A0E9XWT4_ANGAN